MRILVTNDDGVSADGIAALERIARALSDDVWTVAPETDQSGVAHALTLADPLRLKKLGERRYAVTGTPTDCVILGVKYLLAEKRPDLILSGVNRGQNIADDVTYSGTIAAAIEGTLLGVRSMALSQAYPRGEPANARFDTAEAHAPDLIRRLLTIPPTKGAFLNINFPACAPEEVKGVDAVPQGTRDQEFLEVEPRTDARGVPYFWLAFRRKPFERVEGTDLAAIQDLRIAVTPLQLDMTHRAGLDAIAAVLPR
jgi:5'-nucleotidase